jgi:hypothetical protein
MKRTKKKPKATKRAAKQLSGLGTTAVYQAEMQGLDELSKALERLTKKKNFYRPPSRLI